MKYPLLNRIATQRMYTEQFIGLDRRPRTNDGAFSAMENMTGEPWPLISSRKKRGLVRTLNNPQGLIANNKLAWIDGTTLYYDGQATPLNNLSLAAGMTPKQLVNFGAYILIFPDGAYYNTVDAADYGYIERKWTQSTTATFAICGMDGVEYPQQQITVSDEAPEDPLEGDYWLNTGDKPHALYRWRGFYSSWIGEATVYVKITAQGIGAGLKTQDNITLSGIAAPNGSDTDVQEQMAALNATHVIQAVDDDYIVVIGLLDETVQTAGGMHADRLMPQMEFVTECNNRLWGCHHGMNDGEIVNEIHASALGDFKNWSKYLGTSQDSYTVSVGTPGKFTGAVTHRGMPYFFKEQAVHKLYGDRPSNYQMQTQIIDGVRSGCGGSLMVCNGVLYYVGDNGVQYFETQPENAGGALGPDPFDKAVAGEYNGRYYLSMQDKAGDWGLYVLDTNQGRGTWHREDASHAIAFAKYGSDLYMLGADGKLWALMGSEGTKEEQVEYRADTGVMGYEYPGHKFLWRLNLRMELLPGASCEIYAEYDGSGIWESKGTLYGGNQVRTYTVPIVPKRCDHMRIRLQGQGEMHLYSIARILKTGADGMSRGSVHNR